MRISDWSSDVCSSDLRQGVGAVRGTCLDVRYKDSRLPAHHCRDRRMSEGMRMQETRDMRLIRTTRGTAVAMVFLLGACAAHKQTQIGRASGRARVCRSV